MRYFIGIDISKFKHTAAVIDQDGVVHIKPFDFDNDIIGFNSFFTSVSSFIQDDFIIGMEDTGHYATIFKSFSYPRILRLPCSIHWLPITSV